MVSTTNDHGLPLSYYVGITDHPQSNVTTKHINSWLNIDYIGDVVVGFEIMNPIKLNCLINYISACMVDDFKTILMNRDIEY